ncbi:MAG: GTP-binding protein [Promethearchaeota archaeon]
MTFDYLFKVIVVGDGAVGKTSLTRKFTTGQFRESYKMTIGVDFSIKILKIKSKGKSKESTVKLQIWDTGGQERFSYVRPLYYRGALGALVCYDLTNRKSFLNLPKWFGDVSKHCGNIPTILIATKTDLEELRVVGSDEGLSLAEQKGIPFFETSAKDGANVENTFNLLTEHIVEDVEALEV